MRPNIPFLAVLLLLAPGPSLRAADIYVSPQGADSAAGLRLAPFQTLERAHDEARAAKKGQPDQPVTVWLGGGDYLLSRPLELSVEDSGTAQCPVIYRAIEGQTPRLLGARRLTAADFTPVSDPATLARIAEPARDKIVTLDLKAMNVKHAKRFADVFSDSGGLVDLLFNGKRMPLSRFPNSDYMTMKRVLRNAGGVTDGNWRNPTNTEKVGPNSIGGEFEYRDAFYDRHAVWQKQLDRGIWFKGYWRVAWQSEAIRVHSIDLDKHTVTFAKPIQGGIGNKYNRPQGNGRESYWLLNLLEEIDQPGEWCIDFVDQKLYFYPPSPLASAEILLADSDEPVVRLDGASHVILRGLTVEANLGHGIFIKNGESNLVAGCTIRNVDKYAVYIDGGKSHTVLSNDLYNLGAGGVWLSGGDEKSTPRVPAGHRVVNNHIHHFAQIELVYAPAVNSGYVGGGGGGHNPAVGMYVANNLIHDTPHGGVLFGSWDSVFEFNEVFRYCTVSNDLGAFYAYDRFERFGGHTFRYNLMHSSDDGDGIYFDLDHPNMTLYGNIAFLKSSNGKRGTGFLYKIGQQAKFPQSIDCRNNIAIQCRYGFVFVTAKPGEAKIENNVAVQCGTAPYTWSLVQDDKEVRTKTKYPSGPNKVYDADPGFVDPSRLDFRLKPDARILKDLPGFKPIPVEKIGLFIDEYRKSLPSDDEIDRYGKRAGEKGLHYDIQDRK
ncbi:MAG: right-handed parallel beta-helix repeat-containing protein [Tepidisphaeraceae bacterium]